VEIRPFVVEEPGLVVEDAPELEVCERNLAQTLVGLGFRGIQLLPRTPSGESGIGRRRRSTQCLTGLPERGCSSRVTKAVGIGGAGWIDRERHQYRSMAWSGLAPVIASEGPLSLIPMRALLAFS